MFSINGLGVRIALEKPYLEEESLRDFTTLIVFR